MRGNPAYRLMFPQREIGVIFQRKAAGAGERIRSPAPACPSVVVRPGYRVRTTSTAKGVPGSVDVVTVPNAPLATAKRM